MKVTRRMAAMMTVATLGLGAASPALADALDDIKARKKLRVAIDLTIPPYGTLDDKLQPSGADVETARLLATDLGVELEIVQTTGANRIPFLLSGKADAVMAAFGITDERKKVIAFSKPYGLIDISVGGPQSIEMKSLDDLAGKRIGVTRGTLNDAQITEKAPSGTNIVRFDDDSSSIAALVSGQVDGFVTASTLINAVAAKNPDKHLVPKFVLSYLAYGVGLRQGDAKLKAWIDDWVVKNTDNGKLGEIFAKWMKKPLDVAELKKLQK